MKEGWELGWVVHNAGMHDEKSNQDLTSSKLTAFSIIASWAYAYVRYTTIYT